MAGNNIEGKVVVITGASSGLGEATARHLSAQGATVVLGARRVDRIQSLANELTGQGGKALAVTTDVTDCDQVKRWSTPPCETYGRIDVMLNNAGLMPQSPLERLKIDEWDRMIDVNIKGVLYGIAAALPHMQQQKAGHIINVSSVAGHKVRAGGAVYAATKHAVRALSEGLRQEVKPYNIRTTVISPGAVATELPNSVDRAGRRARTCRSSMSDSPFPPIRSRGPSPSPSASRRTWTSTRSCSGPRDRSSERSTTMEIKRIGSQPSGKGPADWFTGAVRIDPLFQPPDPARAAGASVTFEPGARTAWHTHPLGQTLIVTAGCRARPALGRPDRGDPAG